MKTLSARFGVLGGWRGDVGGSGLGRSLIGLLLAIVLLSGCGGGVKSGVVQDPANNGNGTGTNGGSTASSGPTAVLVNLGGFDSMPPQIVSFDITLDGVGLRSSTGEFVTLSTTYRRFEILRLSSKLEPLLFANVPRGEYSAIVIGVSAPRVSFIDGHGDLHKDVAASLTAETQTLNIPLSIRSAPAFFNLTLLGSTVTFGEGDVVKVSPKFATSSGLFEVQNGVGIVNDLLGRVSDIGTSSFLFTAGNDFSCCFPGIFESFEFAIDSSSEFQGLAGFGSLARDMTVKVNAVFYSDGTLRANKVALESNLPNVYLFEGILLQSTSGQLHMLVREVHGPYEGVDAPIVLGTVGNVILLNTGSSTSYKVDSENVDLNNLSFSPAFDAITIAPGQNVRSAAQNPSPENTIADELKLEQQSLDGIAGALTPGSVPGQYSFSLAFSADSAMAKITGSNSVLVTVQPSTWLDTGDPMAPCASCMPGKAVSARGLLFYSGGQFRLVASSVAIR